MVSDGLPRLVRAGMREAKRTPWRRLVKLTSIIVVAGLMGVSLWVGLAPYVGSLVASPFLIFGVLVTLGGLYAVGQLTMRVYVRDDTVPLFDPEIRRLAAAWTMYSFLFVVGAAFFIVPGVYVLARLAPYIPRVAHGDDVFAGVTATWEGNTPYVKPVMEQGLVYVGTGLFLAACLAGLPVLLVLGIRGVMGSVIAGVTGYVFGSVALVLLSVVVNSYMVGVAREIGSFSGPRAR